MNNENIHYSVLYVNYITFFVFLSVIKDNNNVTYTLQMIF